MIFQINSPKYGIKNVLIDDEDWDKVKNYKWHIIYNKPMKKFYVKSGKRLRLHRLIMDCPTGLCVDHIFGDTLDNRKYNLRICTFTQNRKNTVKHKETATSKYKGIYWNKRDKAWRCQIRTNNKQIFLGNFKNEIEGAIAYNQAAIKYHGEFARLNEVSNGRA
jgi:hypothetical protein